MLSIKRWGEQKFFVPFTICDIFPYGGCGANGPALSSQSLETEGTGEQAPRGQGHHTHNTTQQACTSLSKRLEAKDSKDTAHATNQACTPVNTLQEAKDTKRTTQQACTPENKRQEAKYTAHTTHQVCTPVNKRQEAMDTAHRTQHSKRARR